MYIEYVILDRQVLESEEFSKEPVWCAYELNDFGNKVAIGVCGRVPEKYKDQAMSFGEVEPFLCKPYTHVYVNKGNVNENR